MTNFKVTIVSDTTCPWCYVAKKNLDKGIDSYKKIHENSDDSFTVEWLPFYLNPGVLQKSIDKKAYYYQKYGEGQAEGIFARLTSVGAETGINFKFGGKTGNTRDSHRLIHFAKAKSPEVLDRVVGNLFAAYFENEQDITSHEVLKRAGVEAGIPETEVTDLLASDEGGQEVDEKAKEARSKGIMGVPHITLQDRYRIGNLQDTDAFVAVLESIKEAERS